MHAGGGQFHLGDMIFQLFSFGFLFAIIFGVIFLFITLNKRSKERLELQRMQVNESTLIKEEIADLKTRLAKVESLLKEVD